MRKGSHVLTVAEIRKIRRRWRQREKGSILAKEFGVCHATISFIVNNRPPYDKIK